MGRGLPARCCPTTSQPGAGDAVPEPEGKEQGGDRQIFHVFVILTFPTQKKRQAYPYLFLVYFVAIDSRSWRELQIFIALNT